MYDRNLLNNLDILLHKGTLLFLHVTIFIRLMKYVLDSSLVYKHVRLITVWTTVKVYMYK